MINNIDLLSSLRASTQGSNSKTVSFISSAADKPNAFRDSLKVAERSRGQSETWKDEKIDVGAEESKTLRKDLVRKSESKLRSVKKIETKDGENVNPVEEDTEKQTDAKEAIVQEILSQLEELSKLQQLGGNTADKQAVLLENIEKAISDLASVQANGMEETGTETEILQTKLAELSMILKGMQEELKTNGSLTGKEVYENFADELSTILKEISAEAETTSNKPVEHSAPEQLAEQADSTTNELAGSNRKAEDKSYEELSMQNLDENDNKTAKSSMTNEAPEKQKHDIIAEEPNTDKKQVTKEAQPVADQSAEDVKTALDSKVEKVDVSDKSKKQDTEGGSNNETSKEVYKAADAKQNKPAYEEVTAIKLEQTVIDNKLEAVQNQAVAPKAQTVNKADVINQIVKKAEVIINDAQPEIRMQLEPENLGKLTLSIAVEKGLIIAKFVAESKEVKQIIESNFNELKDMLQEKGLEVQNFSVSVGHGDDRGYNSNNAFQQWKETVKLNGRSMMRGSYEGYLDDDMKVRTVNPYSVHNGEFDHRA